jgi:predicted RNase H-like HicB family nuclease
MRENQHRLWSTSKGSEVSMPTSSYTAILEKEGDLYVALCPELDVASQGESVEGALANLKEAVELFLESADPAEITRRLHGEVFITRFDAVHG